MDSDLGDLQVPTEAPENKLTSFEGHEVAFTKVKLTSTSDLEVGDRELTLDGTYRMFVEGKIVGVNYIPNRDGKLVRVHTLKVTDTQLMDWEDGWRD